MYTRCQGCHTVHPVNAALLARGKGKYRCGKCHKIGNALEALFDEWPDASAQGVRPGELPELGGVLPLSSAGAEEIAPGEAALPGDGVPAGGAQSARRKKLVRVLWVSGALVLAAIIALNLAIFFRQPLLERPGLQPILIWLGLKEAPPEPPFRDPGQIELVSREMTTHPSRPDVLLLTAVIVNRAARTQPYPDIEVSLLDVRGRRLVRQLFSPGDYLSRSSELRTGMIPGAYLTFSLEMLDPGDEAMGFELEFR